MFDGTYKDKLEIISNTEDKKPNYELKTIKEMELIAGNELCVNNIPFL